MKFVLATHGTRGDVEPCAAIGRELARRGHEVRMAVPPNLVGLVESAGLAAVAYGQDAQEQMEAATEFARSVFTLKKLNPTSLARELTWTLTHGWAEMSKTLTSLADGADLLVTGQPYFHVAANVAEYFDIPVAAIHYFPIRVNAQIQHLALPPLPKPLTRSAMRLGAWVYGRATKAAEDAQRRELGLPKAKSSAGQRMLERGSLEIQVYDHMFFPGLAAEWNDRRPFVGGLTLQLPTDVDDEVTSWIAEGTPPIYFGFGSNAVQSADDTVAMIAAACTELGERGLICTDPSAVSQIPDSDRVKVVGPVSHAAVFPACRAVVHHGGAGTTAAGLRAGKPMLILWQLADQPIWGAQLKRLKIGSARRFWRTTQKSLVADLRTILAPEYAARAREIATRMTAPAAGATKAADLLEDAARQSA
jgi:UDP:flavonoid glycosyltransferase YjiC (YdhE family)